MTSPFDDFPKLMPDGIYRANLVTMERRVSKMGTCLYHKADFVIVEGLYRDRMLFETYVYKPVNDWFYTPEGLVKYEKAFEIGDHRLTQLADAIGVCNSDVLLTVDHQEALVAGEAYRLNRIKRIEAL